MADCTLLCSCVFSSLPSLLSNMATGQQSGSGLMIEAEKRGDQIWEVGARTNTKGPTCLCGRDVVAAPADTDVVMSKDGRLNVAKEVPDWLS